MVDNWYSGALNRQGFGLVNLTDPTQLRLRFTLDDDQDKRTDAVRFSSGNASAAYIPQFIVQYYIP